MKLCQSFITGGKEILFPEVLKTNVQELGQCWAVRVSKDDPPKTDHLCKNFDERKLMDFLKPELFLVFIHFLVGFFPSWFSAVVF